MSDGDPTLTEEQVQYRCKVANARRLVDATRQQLYALQNACKHVPVVVDEGVDCAICGVYLDSF